MMDKTLNINISGFLFKIDEEAFGILRDYLQAINNRFRNVRGGVETIEDIETRIAEIFQSQRGTAGVVTLSNVEAMIAIIGKPEDFDNNDAEPEPQNFTVYRKRMYRNPDDTIISGVCGGIGAYLNTDPVLFRILFVLSTCTFGVGIFLYLALWVALPPASNDTRKREMYGSSYQSAMAQTKNTDGNYSHEGASYNRGYYNTSRLGNALNEVFRALGRVIYIIFRILLILFGISFVLIGFLIILCFVAILVFKYPFSISDGGLDISMMYISDFMKYVVNPVLVPWIVGLTLVILVLPMIALIYWGVKMIFWFKAKDGIFSLVGFVLWIMLISALAVLLFNEGISFAETARSSTQKLLPRNPDTLYIRTTNNPAAQKFGKELTFGENGYSILINDESKELYIRPYMKVFSSGNDVARIEFKKRSSGRNEVDAMKKTEDLIYNCNINGDTLILDDYFTLPAGRKWAADNVGINIYVPEGTNLKLDRGAQRLLHSDIWKEYFESADSKEINNGTRSWKLTGDGLEPADTAPAR